MEPPFNPSPCPLCGGKAYANRTVNGTEMFHVGCASCGLELKAAWYRGEDKPTKDILTLWNTRAEGSSETPIPRLTGWQPVDTMPNDGREIITYDDDEVALVYWHKDKRYEAGGAWYTSRGFVIPHPKGWMPSPLAGAVPSPAPSVNENDIAIARTIADMLNREEIAPLNLAGVARLIRRLCDAAGPFPARHDSKEDE